MYPETAAWSWEPFDEFRRLQRDLNRLFHGAGASQEPFPALNIYGNEEKALVTAELPGVDPKQLGINVNGNRLSIEGERKLDAVSDGVVCHRCERGQGRFARTVMLPFNVDADKVSASYRNGILTITLPREESAKPRKIQITQG